MNGILIGGARDLHKLDDDGEKFKVNYDISAFPQDKRKDIEDKITAVEKAVNDFIDARAHLDLDAAGNLTKEEKAIKDFLKAEEYKYEEDGYYTYYATYIQHSDDEDDCWKYGVSRNTVYELGVESFGFFGSNGDGKIGDGPKESEIQDFIMNLKVEIKDWELNQLNNAWKL